MSRTNVCVSAYAYWVLHKEFLCNEMRTFAETSGGQPDGAGMLEKGNRAVLFAWVDDLARRETDGWRSFAKLDTT
jgi:hypothetical protein